MNKIRKGDEVILITGKDKGKHGAVIGRLYDEYLLVEGLNLARKHTKPNPAKGVQGGIVEQPMPVHQSNVAIFNKNTAKADRVAFRIEDDGSRVRVYKSTGDTI